MSFFSIFGGGSDEPADTSDLREQHGRLLARARSAEAGGSTGTARDARAAAVFLAAQIAAGKAER